MRLPPATPAPMTIAVTTKAGLEMGPGDGDCSNARCAGPPVSARFLDRPRRDASIVAGIEDLQAATPNPPIRSEVQLLNPGRGAIMLDGIIGLQSAPKEFVPS